MLILLPPSEGKATPPARGRPLDLASLSLPELTATREFLMRRLRQLVAGPHEAALEALRLTPGLIDALAKNGALTTSATLPVERLYAGVLYDALDLANLPTPAKRRARRDVIVFSALFGILHLSDRIPAYRLSPQAQLPDGGTIASAWREPLAETMPTLAARGPLVDLRSGPYAALWRPKGEIAERTVAVRVLHEACPGDSTSRSIVSHFNKATKGRLARDLLLSTNTPRSIDAVVTQWRDHGWDVEETASRTARHARSVDVIVTDV